MVWDVVCDMVRCDVEFVTNVWKMLVMYMYNMYT